MYHFGSDANDAKKKTYLNLKRKGFSYKTLKIPATHFYPLIFSFWWIYDI